MKVILCTLILIVAVNCYPNQVDKGKLKFKLSAKGLPDEDSGIGTSDPYVEVYLAESFGKETRIGKSNIISNSENPDWSTVFELTYDRTKNQQLHFVIFDEDTARTDEKIGQAWLNVNDYVDKGQVANVPLYKQGYITIQSTEGKPVSAPRVWPESQKIKIKLSAENLPSKDKLGGIDPYAEIFSVDGITGKETKVGRTSTLTSNKSPQWGDTFEYQYDAKKNQRWIIRIWDNDNLQTDDKSALGHVDVEDYIRRGQITTVGLNKQGKLTIQRADGLPAVPPTAASTVPDARGPTTKPTTSRPPFRSG